MGDSAAGAGLNNRRMVWDIFCRVIDNFGDIGVCWRLAAALGARGHTVRLWVDDASALTWMAPGGALGVEVQDWASAEAPSGPAPGDVVIEAFGCELPQAFVARMARRRPAAVWINLEYLSAEPYAARSHGLRSPQNSGPGRGLNKWFFYPGFTASTGGLPGAQPPQRAALAADQAWLAAQGWAAAPGEQAITLFAYANPVLPALLDALADRPTLLRVPPGAAQAQLRGLALPAGLRWVALPYLSQIDFDRLLASGNLNLVRGEDSFVRAQLLSDSPFLWQIYPQADGAHAAKLGAFLDLYLADAPPALAGPVRALFERYNDPNPGAALVMPDWAMWRAAQSRWRARLLAQTDLCSRLLVFVQTHAA